MTNFVAVFLSVLTASATVAAAHQTRTVTAVAVAAADIVAGVTAVAGVAMGQVVSPLSAGRPQLLRIRQTRERHGPRAVVASHLLALGGTAQ